jgi:hypothetical protein
VAAFLNLDLERRAQDVSSGMIKRAVAIGIASAAAMDAGTPLYAKLLSNGNAVEQLTRPDRFPVLGAQVTGGRRSAPRPYTMLGLDDVARSDNKGPDDYLAPRYRNGKCVDDEGNTLMAEPTFGGGVRKMEGKSLERALALLCRAATLQR